MSKIPISDLDKEGLFSNFVLYLKGKESDCKNTK